jgi:hypothetical protein
VLVRVLMREVRNERVVGSVILIEWIA